MAEIKKNEGIDEEMMNELVKEHLTQKDAEVQEMIIKLTGKFDEMEIKHQV